MANESRRATRRVLELAEEEVLLWEQIARDCLNYMSEADVKDMAEGNGYFDDPERE